MKENIEALIYLDSKRYISIQKLRVSYWAFLSLSSIMIVFGIAAINSIGLNWKSLFPLISFVVWSLFYWIFVLTLQSNKTKNTFELRFLVNGISGLLISSLFWALFASVSLFHNNPLIGFDFSLLLLIFYLLCSVLYIGLVVWGVHKGVFRKIKEKSQTPKVLAASAFFSAILPNAGIMGIYSARILRKHASVAAQDIIGMFSIISIIFLPILAHINFVQYFYCKKYKIICDEYGDTTSPMLEYHKKTKRNKAERKKGLLEQPNVSNGKSSKKKIPLIVKILIGVFSIPIILFFIVFLVFFIKGFIRGIS